MPTVDEILDCLNRMRVRATYQAVGDVIGVFQRNVARWLGEHSQRASWVVAKKTGLPTNYSDNDRHPDLMNSPRVISTEQELRELLEECQHDLNELV